MRMLKSFVVPKRHERRTFDYAVTKVCAIIPTHRPQRLTLALVEDLLRYNPGLRVIVVDDCSPPEQKSLELFNRIRALGERVTLLRTPVNTLKAGALNYALRSLEHSAAVYAPDVILTLDDDVVIMPETVPNLVAGLMQSDELAAVCSESRVLNKNKNLLTRLQGLEYHGFNAIRLADEGFYYGPLVMHGMLTAFRASELFAVGGFAERHLIEDYEITARLKARGRSVRAVLDAPAWTEVPETLGDLWRQRARWTYGGITVVKKASWLSVLQDLIGHGFFCSIVVLLDLLIIFRDPGVLSSSVATWIVGLTLLQFVFWYGFQLWLLVLYREGDLYDWLLRISFFPEFLYGNTLALVLTGSYLYLFFTTFKHTVTEKSMRVLRFGVRVGENLFSRLGYTEDWGTRLIKHHV